jgi:hypothetical protein
MNIKDEESDKIDLIIEQNGSRIDIADDTAEIRRSGFSMRFKFTRPDGILINASFHTESFNNAREGLPFTELSGFKNTLISEPLFNKDKVIFISFVSPNFWYYADDTDHRFNSILKSENAYFCTREITGIIDLDNSEDKIDISKVKENEIFLVIIKMEWNNDYTQMIEKNRKMIKLKFII